MTFIALLLNIILCYIFFRRDHIREEQSLRICQGHPNIVKLQEVFQDAVSALCKVLQSRILILYNLLEALSMYKGFCCNNVFTQFIWLKGRLIIVILPGNGQLSWTLANCILCNAHTMFFHVPLFIGLPVRATCNSEMRIKFFLCQKKRQNGGQNFLKTLHVPFPLQWGLFLLEGDRSFLVIWQTELKVDLEWTQRYSLELLALYLCRMIMTI